MYTVSLLLQPCCRQHEDKPDIKGKGKAQVSRFKTVIQGFRVAPTQRVSSSNTPAPTSPTAAVPASYSFTPKVWVDGKVSDKPYGEVVKEIWNTASETPAAAAAAALTPTAHVPAPT